MEVKIRKPKHPENTNKLANSQNTEENILKNKKGSDISNVEKPAPGTSESFTSAKDTSVISRSETQEEGRYIDPDVS